MSKKDGFIQDWKALGGAAVCLSAAALVAPALLTGSAGAAATGLLLATGFAFAAKAISNASLAESLLAGIAGLSIVTIIPTIKDFFTAPTPSSSMQDPSRQPTPLPPKNPDGTRQNFTMYQENPSPSLEGARANRLTPDHPEL